MANLTESPVYEPGVYQIELGDPVIGGPGGMSNRQPQQLANRTAYLKQHVDAMELADFAPKNSPTFTGDPKAPTPTSGDSDTSLATTAFAENLKNGIASINVAGSANVTVTAAQAGCGLLVLTGALTANIELLLPVKNGQWVIANRSTGAYNITVKYPTGTGVVLPQNAAVIVYGDSTNVNSASTAASQLAFSVWPFTPAAGTTVLTIPGGYTPGCVQVEKNGAWLHPAEFTATDGSTITLGTATSAGNILTVYAFKSFTVANAVQKAGDTMGGALALAAGSTAPNPATGNRSTLIATMQKFADEFGASLSGSGYQKLPSGLIIQWGYNTSGTGVHTVTFPIAFPNACLQLYGNAQGGAPSNGNLLVNKGTTTNSVGGFVAQNMSGASATISYTWLALGY